MIYRGMEWRREGFEVSFMKTRRGKWFLLTAVILAVAVISGCAPGADQTRTIEDLKMEASGRATLFITLHGHLIRLLHGLTVNTDCPYS